MISNFIKDEEASAMIGMDNAIFIGLISVCTIIISTSVTTATANETITFKSIINHLLP